MIAGAGGYDRLVSDPDIMPPPLGQTRVILDPSDREKLSTYREEDVRTALARGLKEYLEQLEIEWKGAPLRFAETLQVWADNEQPSKFPSAVLVTSEALKYDRSRMSPQVIRSDSGETLRIMCEAVQEFRLVIWANSAPERAGLVSMVEDAMSPNTWMYGLRLELPFYFNSRATYELLGVGYEDASDSSQKRWRIATMAVTGCLPQIAYNPTVDMVPQVFVTST